MTTISKERLENILKRGQDLEQRLMDPAVMNNPNQLRTLSREKAQLDPLLSLAEDYLSQEKELLDLNQQKEVESDKELISLIDEEIKQVSETFQETEQKLLIELQPKHPNSGRDVLIEIRAGTGGEEAALFSKDLLRMYTRFAEKNQLKVETVSLMESDLNGLKEAIIAVRGTKAFDFFALEAGIHRVQRVPDTESQGRVHTSACSVAVITEAEEEEIEINNSELRIDVYRSSGPGGQSVNTTDSAVRITHIPTGLVVTCQDEKSQHKNKAKALRVLRSRLLEQKVQADHEKASAEKKAQIGSGDRSEKIRTYNFPQNRVTDHRISVSSHSLDRFMEGELESIIEPLMQWHREALMNAEENE